MWRWRDPPAEAPGDCRSMRRVAIQVSIALTVGLILLLWARHVVWGSVVLGIAAVLLITGCLAPPAFAAIDRVAMRIVRGVGHVLTWTLLVPFFYVVCTLARTCLVLGGKDPMARKPASEASSYWVPHRTLGGEERYTRQY